jgi:hypothetical protein
MIDKLETLTSGTPRAKTSLRYLLHYSITGWLLAEVSNDPLFELKYFPLTGVKRAEQIELAQAAPKKVALMLRRVHSAQYVSERAAQGLRLRVLRGPQLRGHCPPCWQRTSWSR